MVGVTPLELATWQDFWCQKGRVPKISYSSVAISTQYRRVTDGLTDRQTDP